VSAPLLRFASTERDQVKVQPGPTRVQCIKAGNINDAVGVGRPSLRRGSCPKWHGSRITASLDCEMMAVSCHHGVSGGSDAAASRRAPPGSSSSAVTAEGSRSHHRHLALYPAPAVMHPDHLLGHGVEARARRWSGSWPGTARTLPGPASAVSPLPVLAERH
jgi:hypothetical protein